MLSREQNTYYREYSSLLQTKGNELRVFFLTQSRALSFLPVDIPRIKLTIGFVHYCLKAAKYFNAIIFISGGTSADYNT